MEETHIAENGIADTETVNPKYDKQINRRLLYYAHHPQFIEHRIQQLEKETSVEQVVEVGSVSLSLIGLILGASGNKRWLLLSVLAAGLLFLKNEKRSTVLTSQLQAQGYRTNNEISHERNVLRALRGDFDAIGASDQQKPEERVRQIMRSLKAQ
uniref:Uncharacterized protein n=1 Tax=Roseihalotalea indica TaxID=2867963 RepID=A0AA49GJ62_9BACT|nr:hypothetical protein K4G66_21690 [Tunicatimonas sp. TK19036]